MVSLAPVMRRRILLSCHKSEKPFKHHSCEMFCSPSSLLADRVLTMKSVRVCFCLALLLPWCVQSQRSSPILARLDEDTQRDLLAVDILNRSGLLNSMLRSEPQAVLRRARAPRPASQVPKRAQQGSRFALSLDVPTSILSVLIDLAKNQDMRTKAAANAELMARIGKRK